MWVHQRTAAHTCITCTRFYCHSLYYATISHEPEPLPQLLIGCAVQRFTQWGKKSGPTFIHCNPIKSLNQKLHRDSCTVSGWWLAPAQKCIVWTLNGRGIKEPSAANS